ncbi:MAG: hypothetical protein ACREN1_06265 [Candidatus Dormibacteria bacterium]
MTAAEPPAHGALATRRAVRRYPAGLAPPGQRAKHCRRCGLLVERSGTCEFCNRELDEVDPRWNRWGD